MAVRQWFVAEISINLLPFVHRGRLLCDDNRYGGCPGAGMRSQYGAKFIDGKISMIGFPQYPDKLLAYLLIGLGNTDMFNASHLTDQLRDTLIGFAARSGPLYGYDFAFL